MIARFPCLQIEGGLLSAEIIDRIADSSFTEGSAEVAGQKPADFGLPNKQLLDEVSSSWNDAVAYWGMFHKHLDKLGPEDQATTITRDRWMIPFLSLLGYDLVRQPKAVEIDALSYAFSHRAGQDEHAPPVFILGYRQDIDRRPESGRPRLAPHSLIQEFLNKTEELWGIVTNGRKLRLLRDSHLVRRQAYIEFNLEQMMEGDRFADFVILYRLLHRTRLPKGADDVESCLLEQYYRQTTEQGGRVREHLRDGVERALKQFGNGFLQHPTNTAFREMVAAKTVDQFEYYQHLLRLIYRFLFLMVSEERNLITSNQVYRDHYSISRVRILAGKRNAYNDEENIWKGLVTTFILFADDESGQILSVPTLNGDLFDPERTALLNPLTLSNRDLLSAVWDLSMYRETDKTRWRRINYAALDVEELGSVYESLLDFQPVFIEVQGKPTFDLLTGTERKSTGSYYTPPELVNELIQSALVPVMKDRLAEAKTPAEKEKALLSLTVCDPACGSGHFLLAAARAIGRDLAKARVGDEEPSPPEYRVAIRDAITHCIYGVDKNPLAVDLCKVALWLEGHTSGKPLTFLDHRIRCGDSLVGVFDLSVLTEGIPDDAYKVITGDDREVARKIKQRNKTERQNRSLFSFDSDTRAIRQARSELLAIPDNSPAEIKRKKVVYSKLMEKTSSWAREVTACDMWTGAFFIGLTQEYLQNEAIPTSGSVRAFLSGEVVSEILISIARKMGHQFRFFHWPLEFPEVFAQGGFDCMLGNPPWERYKFNQEEFFNTRDIEIAHAPHRSARDVLIRNLKQKNPILFAEFLNALHYFEDSSVFIRFAGRFPLTGTGEINTYAVFSELSRTLINETGRVGVIVPTGIATDSTTAPFFSDLVKYNRLVSLYDFENRNKLFPIHRSFKFSLLTLARKYCKPIDLAFFLHDTTHLHDPERHFSLTPEEIRLINPNTGNCPIFRSKRDADITKRIYERVPVLVDETKGDKGNPWGISFLRMFDSSWDSNLFRNKEQLESEGGVLINNIFLLGEDRWLPLYEAKMFHQYNHRYGTFAGIDDRGCTSLSKPTEKEHEDPSFFVYPWYWVQESEIKKKVNSGWLISFRGITSPSNQRTGIFSVLPCMGTSDMAPLFFTTNPIYSILLMGFFNSLPLDYVLRQKIGVKFNFFSFKQLPVIDIRQIESYKKFLLPRIIELSFTAWDLESFAYDVVNNIGPMKWNQYFPNNLLQDGKPQPFPWNEARRAFLKAELDAMYGKLYGLTRNEIEYILSTFPVLKKSEVRTFGEYRTARLVMEAWKQIEGEI